MGMCEHRGTREEGHRVHVNAGRLGKKSMGCMQEYVHMQRGPRKHDEMQECRGGLTRATYELHLWKTGNKGCKWWPCDCGAMLQLCREAIIKLDVL